MAEAAKRLITALFLFLGLGAAVAAQDWPTKTVRVVVPFGPGSTPDIVTRLVAEGLQQKYPGSAFLVPSLGQATISAPILWRRPRRMDRRSASVLAARSQSTPCCSRGCRTIRARTSRLLLNWSRNRACSR